MAYKFTLTEKEQLKQLINAKAEPYQYCIHYSLVRRSFKTRVMVIFRLLRAEGIAFESIVQNLDEQTFSIDTLPIEEKQKIVLRKVKLISEQDCPHPFKKIPKQPLA